MRTWSIERAGALASLALHVLAGGALLSYAPAREALVAAAPIMVSLVTPAKIEPQAPVPAPPKAAPTRPHPPPPVLAAPVEAPAPDYVAPPPPEPAPPPPPPAPVPVAVAPPVEVVTPPVFDAAYLRNPAPAYPVFSIRLREEGVVVLLVLVGTEGRAGEIKVQSSSGHARLDASALETVRQWRFVPAKRGDVPLARWVSVPVSFALD
jgi:protein TonB